MTIFGTEKCGLNRGLVFTLNGLNYYGTTLYIKQVEYIHTKQIINLKKRGACPLILKQDK